jgi:hypothetical protein
MIPSPQTNNGYLTYSCWLAARHHQARIYPLNSQVATFAIWPRNPQRIHLLHCSTGLDRKIIPTPVAPSPRQHRRRAEISIAFLAAPLSRGTAGPLSLDAISCIGAFRPPVVRARG